MKVATVGLDIAKQLFQVHGADNKGRRVFCRKLRRSEVVKFFAGLERCLIGMEASGSAHHWSRVLSRSGHTVKLMAPQFVKPYLKSNKNDANDAKAICEAVARPSMRFVPQKSIAQPLSAGTSISGPTTPRTPRRISIRRQPQPPL
jgi:transposase